MKTLKTLASVFFAAMMLTLTGCSKDPEDLIIGSWDVTSMIFSISGLPVAEENGTYTETFGSEYNQTANLTFNKDGSGTAISTYTENGRTETETSSFSYTVDDKKLTITMNGESRGAVYNIDEISKKEITISASETYSDEYFDEDREEYVSYTATEKIIIKMKKA